ncbi:hypothetical protein O206_05730 [Ochrobactrum sp. EGD-AQ16]|nr:hypothetical protein O206_05730 [Ochrobactrum sp. EGD-AQ16]
MIDKEGARPRNRERWRLTGAVADNAELMSIPFLQETRPMAFPEY